MQKWGFLDPYTQFPIIHCYTLLARGGYVRSHYKSSALIYVLFLKASLEEHQS